MRKRFVPGKRRPGFTLIELLVVVVIIGILASVALPSFIDAQDRARNASMQANSRVVQQALEAYNGDHNGRYPFDGAAADGFASTTPGKGFLADNYLPGNQLPKAPWCAQSQIIKIGGDTSTPAGGVDEALPELGVPLGRTGAVQARPTLVNHYGALVYDTWSSSSSLGPQQTSYMLHAIGKRRDQAIIALSRTQRPE